ncbi:MAG: hypothetical protein HRT73_00270 [Flavobacteriales bacterium]|nr:hypothetical protein [Flavobacteriales bacterium]
MFKIFGKKKIKEDVVANIFVNSILNTIDEGFSEIVGIINDAPEFITSPSVSTADDNSFTLIVFAANLHYIPEYLHNSKDDRITNLIYSKLSNVFDCDQEKLERVIKDYQCYLMKVNHPSKNMHYAISKGIFGKYNLNNYQDEYFKNMKSPNPMFLKRLDEAMDNFIWNWDTFKQKNQII